MDFVVLLFASRSHTEFPVDACVCPATTPSQAFSSPAVVPAGPALSGAILMLMACATLRCNVSESLLLHYIFNGATGAPISSAHRVINMSKCCRNIPRPILGIRTQSVEMTGLLVLCRLTDFPAQCFYFRCRFPYFTF